MTPAQRNALDVLVDAWINDVRVAEFSATWVIVAGIVGRQKEAKEAAKTGE